MSDAVSLGMSAHIAVALQPLGASLTPPPAPASGASEHININAPTYISPAISFDPVTNIVFFTFRNPETGKIREQIPPQAVVSRYREVEETGIPNPALPVRPTAAAKAPAKAPAPSDNTPPAPSTSAGATGSTPASTPAPANTGTLA
jgi:hypothetical protein